MSDEDTEQDGGLGSWKGWVFWVLFFLLLVWLSWMGDDWDSGWKYRSI